MNCLFGREGPPLSRNGCSASAVGSSNEKPPTTIRSLKAAVPSSRIEWTYLAGSSVLRPADDRDMAPFVEGLWS